jgi:hypothetical protein
MDEGRSDYYRSYFFGHSLVEDNMKKRQAKKIVKKSAVGKRLNWRTAALTKALKKT